MHPDPISVMLRERAARLEFMADAVAYGSLALIVGVVLLALWQSGQLGRFFRAIPELAKGFVFCVAAALEISFALAALVLLLMFVAGHWRPVRAQHNHHQHHASYKSWTNSDGKGCCNDQDCGEIDEADERETGGELQVYVRGVGVAKGQASWCPVQPRHYLKAGNVPNASVSHACITGYYGGQTPCEQFICYQPKPRM